MSDKTTGLYNQYFVEKMDDPTNKHRKCQYYVLDINHDKFAGAALRAYANACESEYPNLALDIRNLICRSIKP